MLSFRGLLLIALAATTMAASCPQGWTDYDQCCYGSLVAHGSTKYCCVQDTNSNLKVRNLLPRSMPSGGNSDGCFTKIPYTASDYSAQVSSASSKLADATTTPATNEATPTSSGSAAPTTNAAMPIATAHEIALGGAAVIAGLFVL